MAVISVAGAQTGMRLSRSVTNSRGVVLLEAGTILNNQLIARLQNANIYSIQVSGTPDRSNIDQMLSELQKRFEKSRHEAHMALIEEAVKEHIEELYAE